MASSQFNSHQVDILYNLDPICVGTLISSYLVLTVYSCLLGKNETKLKVRALSENQQIRNVESIHSYPALKSEYSENDIAVLLLGTNFGESLRVMRIIDHNSEEPDELVALSSCGNIRVERTEESDCAIDNPNLMCVEAALQSSCPLPLLGSGLICRMGGMDFLCGALAKTRNGANVREYTDISKYLNWIRFTFDMASGNGEDSNDFGLAPNLFNGRSVSSSNLSSPIPYQLSLQRKYREGWRHSCGAVIIDENTVLTAAHCFDDSLKRSDYRVVAGVTQLDSSSTTQQILPLQNIIQHGNYKWKQFFKGNDIAILHVKGSFEYNRYVRNIWISPPDETNLTDFTGRVSGWGKMSKDGQPSNSLQEADMRILTDSECSETVKIMKPSMICTYDEHANTCNGDSGGPLVIKNYQFNRHGIRDRLIGIVSFGPPDCEKPEQANGFTEVSHFYDWIKDNRNQKQAPKTFNNSQEEEDLPKFTAVSSLFFRPGSDYTVFFTAHPLLSETSFSSPTPLQLKCVLMANSSQSTTIESGSISLLPGESGHISIPLPQEMPGGETVWRLFTWHFTNTSAADGYKKEAPHSLIQSSQQNTDAPSLGSVFIQTDKPAYKPGDLVRIRVITMGTDGLPHSGVNMTLLDSRRYVMKEWEQPLELPESASVPSNVSSDGNPNDALFGESQKNKNGLSSYEYQLSGEPILGNWEIYVLAGNIYQTVQFEVQKNIVPKFQVQIQAPPVLYGTGEISAAATIKVSYTYGKGLQGTGTVTVTDNNGGSTKIQEIVVKNGEVQVPLTFSSSRTTATVHTITANVTEKNTGRWQIGNTTVRIYPQETYSFQWINKPSSYKPGLPLTVQLKITTQDGYPVKDVRANSVRITFPPSLNLPPKETSIPLSGIANFTFPAPLQRLPANSKFQVEYKRSKFDFTLPTAARGTSSGIFIEILSPSGSRNFIQGNAYKFTIRSNKPIQPELFHCLLWDDLALDVHGGQVIPNHQTEPTTQFPFTLQLPKGDYKELKLFVYFETQVGGRAQVISTYKSIHMRNYLKIRVSRQNPTQLSSGIQNLSHVDTSYNSTVVPSSTTTSFMKPGDAIQIHFETYPGSIIAIRGVETSLLLADLDPKKVQAKRATSQIRNSIYHSLPKDKHSSPQLKTFRRLGVSVLSNERFNPFEGLGATSAGETLEESELAASENLILDEPTIPQMDSRLHPKFPETWLWEEFQSSSNSTSTVLSKTLPDTLTSWIISGFSLNPRTGLGVASPATITGFMPFFVTLNLPYSVVKYESFDLQVIVHNYLDRDVNVWVTLVNRHNDFEFEDREERQNGLGTRFIKVEENQAALTHFVITPMTFGDIPIEVKVVSEDGTAGDSMLRHLKVKPDGVKEIRRQFLIFPPKRGDKNLSRMASLKVNSPKNAVKGASSLQLMVAGGGTIDTPSSNLSYLLRLPYGSGETNMRNFAQNILVLHFLSTTNSSDAEDLIQEAKRNLESGYAHQLRYRKSDGSFAVFDSSAASIWLTANVLKWFTLAHQYITIDPNVIRGAINFVRTRQQSDGSFVETGPFYHPEMRGRTGSAGVALTAYITLALIKANKPPNNDLDLKVAIENGMNFISQESTYQLDDNYITNLVTATLMAGNHPEKTRFFEKMEKGANTTIMEDIEVKFWGMLNYSDLASDPLAIEMTSYALLAHLWQERQIDSSLLGIYIWLLEKRNPNGGFISYLDTIMGLTALSEFTLRTIANFRKEDEIQLNIRASSNSSVFNDTEIPVIFASWAGKAQHEFNLSVSTKMVSFHAVGTGLSMIRLDETWHVSSKTKPAWPNHDDFNILATMTIPDPDEPTETELTVCINSLIFKGVKQSVASIELPSGYTFSPEDFEDGTEFMKKRPRNIQRFEIKEGNTKVEVYYSEIARHPPTCLSLAATQQIEVANARRPSIVVYDYSNPDVMGTISYRPAHTINPCQLCNSTKACIRTRCL